MRYTAYLQRGKYKLNLAAAPYRLGSGFAPPSIQETANLSTGGSANQYGGATLVGKRIESGGYAFSVNITGSTNAEIESAKDRLERFLRMGTKTDPVYFCWLPNINVSLESLFGEWGAARRCEIVKADVYQSAAFHGIAFRDEAMIVDINLLVNAPEGAEQRVGLGIGGLLEDIYGAPDGNSRGLIVPRGTDNKVPNPIYGHITWNTGWTASSGLDATLNIDPDFVLFGKQSARLVNRNTGSGLLWYITINLGSTGTFVFSKYVKRSDGAAVTSNDCSLYYGAALTTTYTNIGNGWYRLTATATGIASDTVAGLVVGAGRSVYTDGFQIEGGTYVYATPLIHGDMMGCSWAGTAHNSVSTRVNAALRIPQESITRRGYGTIWAAWRAPTAHSGYAQDGYIFYIYSGVNPFFLMWDYANTRWRLGDGTNVINFTDTITAGELFIFHCVYGPSSLKLFINGVEVATGSVYTPPSGQDYLYVLSGVSGTGNIGGTLHGLGSYGYNLTATEVPADYNNMLPVAQGIDGLGGMVSHVLYMYTKDGDNQVDNCDDSDQDNWAIVGGVPGSLPAKTRFIAAMSDTFANINQVNLACTQIDWDKYLKPSTWLFKDISGTGGADTCGGEYDVIGLFTSGQALASFNSGSDLLKGKEFYIYARVYDAGSNLMVRADIGTAYITIQGAYQAVSSAAEWRLVRAGPISAWSEDDLFIDYLARFAPTVFLSGKRSTGSGDLRVDFICLMPRPLVTLYDSLAGFGEFIYQGGRSLVVDYVSSTEMYAESMPRQSGDVIEFEPGKANILMALMGCDGIDTSVALTLTFSEVYVTPRWALA